MITRILTLSLFTTLSGPALLGQVGFCPTNGAIITVISPNESGGQTTYGLTPTQETFPQIFNNQDLGQIEFNEFLLITDMEADPVAFSPQGARITNCVFRFRVYETGTTPPGFSTLTLQDTGHPGTVCMQDFASKWNDGNAAPIILNNPSEPGNYTFEFEFRATNNFGVSATVFERRVFFVQLAEPEPEPEPIDFDLGLNVLRTSSLTFATQANRFYNIQHRFSLDTEDWIDAEFAIVGTGSPLTRFRTTDARELFLRVLESEIAHASTEPATGPFANQLVFLETP
ncbi:MAG: hypothetical protein ACFB20_12490 [Opitutales bacterium]